MKFRRFSTFATGFYSAAVAVLIVSLSLATVAAQPPSAPNGQIPGAPGGFPPGAGAPEQGPAVPGNEQFEIPGARLNWQIGPCKGPLGDEAAIEVPAGFKFLNTIDTRLYMQELGNLVTNIELGTIAPMDQSWFVVFEFEGTGYIKDEDRDSLDADALLKGMKERDELANAERRKRNLTALNIVGWEIPPSYNPQTNNLEWALRLNSPVEGDVINYQSRILGRKGVMHVVLVTGPDQLQATLPTFRQLLTEFKYNPGNTYAEFRAGDRVAEYGLAALVAGGGLAVAAKTGILAKLGVIFAKGAKFIVLAVVAVFAAIAKLLGLKKRKTGS